MPFSVLAVPSRLVIVSFVKSTSARSRSDRRGVNWYQELPPMLYRQFGALYRTAIRWSLVFAPGGLLANRVLRSSADQRIQPVPTASSRTLMPLFTAPKSRHVYRLLLLVLCELRLLLLELRLLLLLVWTCVLDDWLEPLWLLVLCCWVLVELLALLWLVLELELWLLAVLWLLELLRLVLLELLCELWLLALLWLVLLLDDRLLRLVLLLEERLLWLVLLELLWLLWLETLVLVLWLEALELDDWLLWLLCVLVLELERLLWLLAVLVLELLWVDWLLRLDWLVELELLWLDWLLWVDVLLLDRLLWLLALDAELWLVLLLDWLLWELVLLLLLMASTISMRSISIWLAVSPSPFAYTWIKKSPCPAS